LVNLVTQEVKEQGKNVATKHAQCPLLSIDPQLRTEEIKDKQARIISKEDEMATKNRRIR
jgi:hypothetical protein